MKPFNMQFRNYGQMSVINLRKKSKVLVDFVRCQNNNNNNNNNNNKKKIASRRKTKREKKKRTSRTANSNYLPSSGMHV